MIRIGGLSALGLGVSDWLHLKSATAALSPEKSDSAKAKRCILIWLDGGPSHLETFDPKPLASREVRGPLSTTATSIPGVRFGECLIESAKRLNKMAIIRSMTSPLGEHNFGTHYMMTGFKPTAALEYPAFTGVGSMFQKTASMLPPHVAVPNFQVGGSNFSGHGFLDAGRKPFSLDADPSKPDFKVDGLDFYPGLDLDRINRRKAFVQQLEKFDRSLQRSGGSGADPAMEQAFQLISSADAKSAFDLNQESAKTRRRYGPKTVGQSCLLARRLVERDVPFITVNNKGWDTHESLVTRLKDGYAGAQDPVGLIPSLDLGLSALLDDLSDRNLLDETLVVVMGEFGRTPKLNVAGGRDHWPRVFSVALAGGGIPGGQIIGSSDKVGEQPQDRPVTPSDLVATIYSLLGIDPKLMLKTPAGRPIRVTPEHAQPIAELVG
jgi:hypothetical protein